MSRAKDVSYVASRLSRLTDRDDIDLDLQRMSIETEHKLAAEARVLTESCQNCLPGYSARSIAGDSAYQRHASRLLIIEALRQSTHETERSRPPPIRSEAFALGVQKLEKTLPLLLADIDNVTEHAQNGPNWRREDTLHRMRQGVMRVELWRPELINQTLAKAD